MTMPVAWQEGYAAAADDDKTTEDCPYDFASPAYMQWMAGYEAYLNEQGDLIGGFK